MTKVNLYQNEKSMQGKEEDDDSKRTRSSVKHDGAKVFLPVELGHWCLLIM